MTIEQIRDAYPARPFRTFKFVLLDGRKLEVYDDCCLAIAPNGRGMVVLDRRGRWTFLEPPNVDSLEYPAPTANGNSAAPTV
jgi:hypothetical protein